MIAPAGRSSPRRAKRSFIEPQIDLHLDYIETTSRGVHRGSSAGGWWHRDDEAAGDKVGVQMAQRRGRGKWGGSYPAPPLRQLPSVGGEGSQPPSDGPGGPPLRAQPHGLVR